jgi:transketolase
VINALIAEAEHERDIVVLDADVSKSTRTRLFGKRFPDRFFNTGIAEMHMVSMAAGLASAGMRPVVSSFAVFLALRAVEPIRTQIAYDTLPVVMLGGYAGLTAMQHGPTHQCICDIGILRAIPHITIFSPSDSQSAADLVIHALRMDRPVYIRLGYNVQRLLYPPAAIRPLDCYLLHRGKRVLIAATGLSTANALAAVSLLNAEGIDPSVVDVPTLKPFPASELCELAKEHDIVFTVEEHTIYGGLYESLCSALTGGGIPKMVFPCSTGTEFGESAPYAVLLDAAGLSPVKIALRIKDCVSGTGNGVL